MIERLRRKCLACGNVGLPRNILEITDHAHLSILLNPVVSEKIVIASPPPIGMAVGAVTGRYGWHIVEQEVIPDIRDENIQVLV